MENYIKAVLYAYPYLQETTRAYQVHIRTQALFSCDGRMQVEKLAEYLAEEILRKRRLLWVKETVEGVLATCNGWERAMVEVLFFGRKCARKLLIEKYAEQDADLAYWRRCIRGQYQQTLLQKVERRLQRAGLTEELFHKELLEIELLRKSFKYVLKKEEQAKRDHSSGS